MTRRRIIVFLLIVAPLCALSFFVGRGNIIDGLRSHRSASDTLSYARLESGPFDVAVDDYSFVDTSRRTMSNGEYGGAATRTLEVTLWQPHQAEGALPLLVYSHGFSGNRREMIYVLEHLASHGYLVAAIDFPLTKGDAPGGPNQLDLVSQPGDVRFVIDSVLHLADPDQPLAGRIDPTRIAVAGLSYGGLTSTLVAFHAKEVDRRIKAAISIAGPTQMFSDDFFEAGDPPFLMIAGTSDALVPYAYNAAPLRLKNPAAGPPKGLTITSIHGTSGKTPSL